MSFCLLNNKDLCLGISIGNFNLSLINNQNFRLQVKSKNKTLDNFTAFEKIDFNYINYTLFYSQNFNYSINLDFFSHPSVSSSASSSSWLMINQTIMNNETQACLSVSRCVFNIKGFCDPHIYHAPDHIQEITHGSYVFLRSCFLNPIGQLFDLPLDASSSSPTCTSIPSFSPSSSSFTQRPSSSSFMNFTSSPSFVLNSSSPSFLITQSPSSSFMNFTSSPSFVLNSSSPSFLITQRPSSSFMNFTSSPSFVLNSSSPSFLITQTPTQIKTQSPSFLITQTPTTVYLRTPTSNNHINGIPPTLSPTHSPSSSPSTNLYYLFFLLLLVIVIVIAFLIHFFKLKKKSR
jgi:hypothetical protein